MTEHEKYQEHIRHTHDAFCKTVIRHAAIDAARSIRSRRKREISLEYLIEEKHYPFSTTDKYFAEQSGMTSYPLFVCGQMVLLESPELAAALSALSQMEQEIIFLYYFQRLTHREIGRRYGRAGNTTGRRIQMILRRLRAELEGLSYEPATSLWLNFSSVYVPHIQQQSTSITNVDCASCTRYPKRVSYKHFTVLLLQQSFQFLLGE